MKNDQHTRSEIKALLQADIAVNWAGGLHHAKKCEASGFCYAINTLLQAKCEASVRSARQSTRLV